MTIISFVCTSDFFIFSGKVILFYTFSWNLRENIPFKEPNTFQIFASNALKGRI